MSDDQVKQAIDKYAADVCAGEIIASSWVVRAAGRYLDDLAHQFERGLIFDEAAAAHVIKFFEFLKHSKGEWGGFGAGTVDARPSGGRWIIDRSAVAEPAARGGDSGAIHDYAESR